ncbi:SNF2-related protein [Sulfurospirillum multivorans]|nr:DEAD/DEAH box helicase [Sulfurospirillum multivorans]
MEDIEPHVSIRLKKLFPKIPIYQVSPFHFKNTPDICSELEWFMIRYPLVISKQDFKLLKRGSKEFERILVDLDSILLPNFEPRSFKDIFIHENKQPRHYQWQMAELVTKKHVSLCADVMGLGKTITGIATIALNIQYGYAAVVVPTHLVKQWKDKIEEFTNLTVHIIKKGSPYNLPKADVYLFKYGMIRGWTEIFEKRFFYTVIFDEIQELRRGTVSQRGAAAKIICAHTTVRLGMSGTPIYGYGGEIWNIYNILQEGVLGTEYEFHLEWCTSLGNDKYKVNDPEALGQYLREHHLLIRRTKQDVGIEIGRVTRIIETVSYEENYIKSFEEIAKQLAITATTGSFVQRGQASMELDMKAHQITGIAKARGVAEIVKVLLESGEPVLLSGWHREVYKIWLDTLSEYNPVLYTGTETSQQKEKNKQAFISGQTNLIIISNRSGAGLDGLQFRCSTLIVGELDWSPKTHEQLEFRLDREGQPYPIMVIYPVADGGSDPVIMDLCGLKNSQADGIVDPDGKKDISYGSDETRIKKLVEYYLNK